MKMTLAQKLSLGFLFAVLVSILLASLISNYLVGKRFSQYLVDEHNEKISNVINIIKDGYTEQKGLTDISKREIQRYADMEELFIEIKNTEGKTVYSTGNLYLQHKRMMENMMGPMMHNFSGMNIGEYKENKYSLKSGGKEIGILTIGYFGTSYISFASITFMRTLNKSFAISGLIALAFGLITSLIISKQLSRPLVKITETSNKMRAGNLEVRAEVNTNTKEIDELSDSINYLAKTLKEQEMLRKRLTSDIAHELRTPLTTLKTHLEAFIDGVWEPTRDRLAIFYEEIERLTKLVDNLRNLAKLEQVNAALNKSEVNVSDELKKILSTFRPLFIKKGYELYGNIAPDVSTVVDKDKFKQIMHNLLTNSYNYLKENGKVEVVLLKQKQKITIKVVDNGIGIPERDLPHIFERFYRSDLSRSKNTGGSGLGLTITKALVEAHGGRIYAESKLGEGTIFTIELPA